MAFHRKGEVVDLKRDGKVHTALEGMVGGGGG